MMAVTRPWPGDRIKVGAPITVEIAAVDFTWADPTGEAGPGRIAPQGQSKTGYSRYMNSGPGYSPP